MKLFVTRVWNFDPMTWPAITFCLESARDNLLSNSSPGDKIVYVGTLREPTVPDKRGRLLGMVEIGRIPIDTADLLEGCVSSPHNFDKNGYLRWPKALLMNRAWHFAPQPLLHDVVEEQLPYHATSQEVVFSGKDMSYILALASVKVPMPDIRTLFRAKNVDNVLGHNSPTIGPVPSSWSRAVTRNANQNAFTYAMRFGDSDVWKIGYATDVQKRTRQLNEHIPEEIISHCWYPMMTQRWETEMAAYEMEQQVLKELVELRTSGERVQCSENEIFSAWKRGIGRHYM